MAPWSFMRVNYVPMTLGVMFTLGLCICYVVAVALGHVSPYLPFISETGGNFPEAGIFSIFLYLCSIVGFTTMFVRYLIVEELNSNIDKGIDILNRAAVIIGFIALLGMVVVGAYPMTSIATAHAVGANTLFLGGVIYAILQTCLSYKMSPFYNGKSICHIRLAITVLSTVAFICLLITMPLAIYRWKTISHGSNRTEPGMKMPEDKGFDLLLLSSVAEWSMAIGFIAYYFTFIREFRKVLVHLRVQLLVQHFDEEPEERNIPVATERTPMIM